VGGTAEAAAGATGSEGREREGWRLLPFLLAVIFARGILDNQIM
jgi:hypothetical protein